VSTRRFEVTIKEEERRPVSSPGSLRQAQGERKKNFHRPCLRKRPFVVSLSNHSSIIPEKIRELGSAGVEAAVGNPENPEGFMNGIDAVRRRAKHRRPNRHFGRPPKNPGAIAPQCLALFAEIAHPRKRAFLAAYVQEGGHTARARKTACGGAKHWSWLRSDAAYRAAFERAKCAVAEAAEREIFRQAAHGPRTDSEIISVITRMKRRAYGERRLVDG